LEDIIRWTRLKRLSGLLAVMLAATLLVAACSDDDDTATADPEVTATESADPTEAPTEADDMTSMPGEGVTVQPARATWNTGYFQEALYSRGLEELGYNVEDFQELDNPIFYQAVALGDVDFWANGWFPAHNQYSDLFSDGATLAGTVIAGGALQGYLIDKAGADEFGITSLADFERPEVAEAYDTDGNGKANLTACPEGWGCNTIIGFHLDEFGLRDSIDEGTAGYNIQMADTIARFGAGEHVLFYTWTPNWTVNQLAPGEDVVWINVPAAAHPEGLTEEQLTATGIPGAVSDPLLMGFASSDIMVVANQEFLDENPAAAALFDAMQLTLADVAGQNDKMNAGENSQPDIEGHVDEWIAANQATWDSWLQAARDAA